MSKVAFVCSECGNETLNWQGKCDACDSWNTIKEFKVAGDRKKQRSSSPREVELFNLADTNIATSSERMSAGEEIDRVLGGGLAPGAVVLIGGEPGIGKSTLLLQIADTIGKKVPVRYISGEESVAQIAERARRLKVTSKNLSLCSLSSMEEITQVVRSKPEPGVLIVDSIQTTYDPEFPSTPGSVVQVRECTMKLAEIAKANNMALILTSHVTKEGTVAGPRTLEHLVDVVLYLEGDRFHNLRMLRGVKNRFGPTDEVGVFEMLEGGLAVVANPSEIFLKERVGNMSGSAVTAITQGVRPFLVEVQALTTPVAFGYPKRRAIGIDPNRLDLVLAVLEKRAKVRVSNYDIYCSLAGGFKAKDPAIDVAIAAAVISSIKNKAIPKEYVLYGEIGLTGEIRSVRLQAKREKEALRFGFEVPKLKNIQDILNHISK